jgi:hypothetical protein
MLFIKTVTVVIVLTIVVLFGRSFLVPYFRPLPALAVGIHDRDELTARLRQRFPLRSSAAALETELKREGWGKVETYDMRNGKGGRYVTVKRPVSLMFVEVASVLWKSDEDGRLTELHGGYFTDAVFKQGGWS